MILDLDIGNSRTKWRLLDTGRSESRTGICDNLTDIGRVMAADIQRITRVRVSSVGQSTQLTKFATWLRAETGLDCEMARVEPCAAGVNNGYDIPEQLGVDRWMAVCGAYHQRPGANVVVDAGSALTLDFVTQGGDYIGGYIVPGTGLMANALHRDTERVLFDLSYQPANLLPGRSTQQSSVHGMLRMQVSLIEASVAEFGALQGSSITVWLTGGGAESLGSHLKIPHIISSDLIFIGIETLLP